MTEPLLRVRNLVKKFWVGGGILSRRQEWVHAVSEIRNGRALLFEMPGGHPNQTPDPLGW